jgi:hypothetical protein
MSELTAKFYNSGETITVVGITPTLERVVFYLDMRDDYTSIEDFQRITMSDARWLADRGHTFTPTPIMAAVATRALAATTKERLQMRYPLRRIIRHADLDLKCQRFDL